jgi:hypothetical protein
LVGFRFPKRQRRRQKGNQIEEQIKRGVSKVDAFSFEGTKIHIPIKNKQAVFNGTEVAAAAKATERGKKRIKNKRRSNSENKWKTEVETTFKYYFTQHS